MRRKLLLADDSTTIQRVIEQTFADEPVDVEAVSDGEAAIARLDADPPDVVLADIGMPGRDGYEVAMHVRRTPALAHVPVILLTGAFDPIDHARAREAACAGILVKPFDPQMLIARVRQLLDGRHPVAVAREEQPAAGHEIAGGESHRHSSPAPAADPQPPTASLTESPETRAAAVDDYFAHLDRAFANLQPGAPAPRPEDGEEQPPALRASPSDTAMARDKPDAPTARPDVPPPGQTATTAVPVEATPPAVASVHVQPPAGPTLADAFAAMLAMEQGRPVPEGGLWSQFVPGDLAEQIARELTREISERVVRELAPGIVSRVAERLVREEIARITSSLTHG